ncbi:MAG: hypothetical protein VX356_04755, partial [Candidatus Thermoplasmatota archaeon]
MGEQRPSNMAEDSTPIEVELKVSENNTQRQLNFSAAATVAFAFTFLMLAMVITSPAANLASEAGPSSVEWWNTPLDERHLMDLPMDTLRAQLPVNGTYQALPYEEHFVEVDLPASEQDAGFPGPALMHVALWLPDVPDGTKIPVIMTIHPYYDFGGEGVAGDDSAPN